MNNQEQQEFTCICEKVLNQNIHLNIGMKKNRCMYANVEKKQLGYCFKRPFQFVLHADEE